MIVEILTPSETVLSCQAEQITLPGKNGYLTVLNNHAPLIVELKADKINLKADGNTIEFVSESGVAIISANKVTVCVEKINK